MDLGIEGKVALVTASSRGLGKASAMALAYEGAKLVITARGEKALAQAEQDLRRTGAEVFAVATDVTAPEVPAQLVAAAVERFEGLDIVVANAGGPPAGRSLDVDDEALLGSLQANLLTSVRLVREALPHMQAAGWGRLVCIASYSVVQPIPTLSLSNTARSGLRAWAKTAALDIAGENADITLNLACPGPHATDRMLQLGVSEGARLGDPDDFGKVVAFLCSAPAAFINGASIVVDGGATLAL